MLLKVNAFLTIILGLTSCYLLITGDQIGGLAAAIMALLFSLALAYSVTIIYTTKEDEKN